MMETLLNWLANTQLGQGAGFLCFLAVPFAVLIIMDVNRRKKP